MNKDVPQISWSLFWKNAYSSFQYTFLVLRTSDLRDQIDLACPLEDLVPCLMVLVSHAAPIISSLPGHHITILACLLSFLDIITQCLSEYASFYTRLGSTGLYTVHWRNLH
jgi:hypothetical protein